MVDLDIKIKHLGWIGDTQFIYGFFHGGAFIHLIYTTSPCHVLFYLIATCQKPYPIKTSLKISMRQTQDAQDLPICLACAGKQLEDMLG